MYFAEQDKSVFVSQTCRILAYAMEPTNWNLDNARRY